MVVGCKFESGTWGKFGEKVGLRSCFRVLVENVLI
jgi:hypothetical protein